jgi:hypothetical protein
MDRAGGNVDDPVAVRDIESCGYLSLVTPHHEFDPPAVTQPARRRNHGRNFNARNRWKSGECLGDQLTLARQLFGIR